MVFRIVLVSPTVGLGKREFWGVLILVDSSVCPDQAKSLEKQLQEDTTLAGLMYWALAEVIILTRLIPIVMAPL